MPLDLTKILYGPFDATFSGGTGVSYTGLLDDAVVITGETKKGEKELEDGSEKHWKKGRKLIVELTVDELNSTDMANIEGNTSLEVNFVEPSLKFTVSSVDVIHTDIDGGKTKITLIKTGDSSKAWSDMYTIT